MGTDVQEFIEIAERNLEFWRKCHDDLAVNIATIVVLRNKNNGQSDFLDSYFYSECAAVVKIGDEIDKAESRLHKIQDGYFKS